MRHLLWMSLFVVALDVPVALAQDNRSAQAMLPRCMASLQPGSQDAVGERCMGILATLTFVSRVLPDNLKFCQPTGTTPEQMMQVIDGFMTANKEAVAQDFQLIALAAYARWRPQKRHTFSEPDLLIAALAALSDLIVVSRDTSEFIAAGVPVFDP